MMADTIFQLGKSLGEEQRGRAADLFTSPLFQEHHRVCECRT
jgi:hypothetical protein